MADPHLQDELIASQSSQDTQIDAIVADLVRYYALDSELPEEGALSQSAVQANRGDDESKKDPAQDLSAGTVRLREDPTLVALAQLGTLHINCQRSFISLIDSKDQYILAEATPSVSLQDSAKCRNGEKIALGAARTPLSFGVCPLTIRPFVGANFGEQDSPHLLTSEKDIYFMSDMSQVKGYNTRPTITNWPFLRFYAGIPLKTVDGQVIGMFSVTDSRTRSGLSEEEIEKLRELASVIVDHLQLVQFQDRLERSRNMIRGLGRFVDGKAVQQLWQDAFDGQLGSLPEQNNILPEAATAIATTLSPHSDSRLSENPTTATMTTLFQDVSETSSQPKDNDFIPISAAATGSASRSSIDIAGIKHKRAMNYGSYFGNEDASSSAFGSGAGTNSGDTEPLVLHDEDVNVAIKTLFSRASHWIRKACDFDGILFVDASVQDIRPRINQRGHKMASSGIHATPLSDSQGSESRSCDLLGFSLEPRPRPRVGLPSTVKVEIPQSTLSGLLRKYPRGKVFQFDEYGHLLQTETVENETRKARNGFVNVKKKEQVKFEKEKEQLEAYQLLDICLGARSIAFFPLWDPHRDQWYAGSLAWSLDPIRVLQHEELMFLGAFGSCVMAEKSKIDMLNADRDKQDFISSVSHELRTPLHGILASVDSLTDLVSHLAQDEMRTIIICGDILLDTMDHILDYSKMARNNQQLATAGGRHKAWQETTDRAGRTNSFDISKLVENVVEGTVAGFQFRHSGGSEKASPVALHQATRVTPPNTNPNVMVILEIEHQVSWLLESQIGAWKRILTNAFGNALKYTDAGFIRVSLQVTPSQLSSRNTITLQIEDSGIGMSNEFLKHGLYTPFVQANPLSVGTGLGLSIVRQLVDDLDGTINIQSEVDYGTRITIKAPFSLSSSEELDLTAAGTNASVRDISAWCKGLTICLIGFDHYPELEEIPTGILNVHTRKMLSIFSSIQSSAEDWFGLKIKRCHTLAEAEGDIFIGLFSQINLAEYTPRPQPLIVFEDFRSGLRPSDCNGLFYLSQPFGPHKFGRVLGLCLEYRSAVPEVDREQESADTVSIADIMSRDYAATAFVQSKDLVADLVPGLATTLPERPSLSRPPSYLEPHYKGHSPGEQSYSSTSEPVQDLDSLAVPELQARSIVLLVEDNPINMKIFVNLMKKANQQHQSAMNGLEAVHAYQADPRSFKVIFMDISMPVKDGIQATKEIRQFEHENSLPRVRIVAVTCFSSAEVQKNAFQSGVDMFTLKPTPMKALKPILEMNPNEVIPP